MAITHYIDDDDHVELDRSAGNGSVTLKMSGVPIAFLNPVEQKWMRLPITVAQAADVGLLLDAGKAFFV